MVINFNSDIRLNFLAHHDSPEEWDNIMFSPEMLRYMHKTVLKEEEEQQRREIAAKEKLLEIFEGNPSEAENFIYEFAAYFMAHYDKCCTGLGAAVSVPCSSGLLCILCTRDQVH